MIVKYRRLYPYAPYLNEEIGFERSIPDESTEEQMIEAVLKLKEIADKAHHRMNPESLPTQTDYHTGEPVGQLPIIDRQRQTLKEIINDCPTKEDLLKCRDSVEKYGLLDYYEKKLEELSK